MIKVECPNCGSKFKVIDKYFNRDSDEYMVECPKCHIKSDVKAQINTQFQLNQDNSPDEFWNKLN